MNPSLHSSDQGERRGYFAERPGDWERSARQAVLDSTKRCIAQAVEAGLARTAPADDLLAAGAMFRELRLSVIQYARGFYALGQTEQGVVGLIIAAGQDAADPARLHQAVAAAMERWCREARTGAPGGADHVDHSVRRGELGPAGEGDLRLR